MGQRKRNITMVFSWLSFYSMQCKPNSGQTQQPVQKKRKQTNMFMLQTKMLKKRPTV